MKTEPSHSPELECRLHHTLRQMPGYKAPASLVHKVMAAIQTQVQLPWWRKPFWGWPRFLQVLTSIVFAGLASLLIGSLWYTPDVWQELEWPVVFSSAYHFFNQGVELISALLYAGQVILQAGLQPWVIGALVVCSLMYVFCLGLGTLALRMAWKKI